MNIPTSLPSDLIDLLVEFENFQVKYLLVGGQAVALHGYPRFTKDADLWLQDTEQNLDHATEALERFGAPRLLLEQLATADPLDVVWMGHPPARLDLMKGVPGGDFARAWETKETHEVAGTQVHVIGREELIRIKRASGRLQDQLDIEKLRGSSS